MALVTVTSCSGTKPDVPPGGSRKTSVSTTRPGPTSGAATGPGASWGSECPSSDPHFAAGRIEAHRLAAAFRSGPGWQQQSAAPVAILGHAPQSLGTPCLVAVSAFWTATGSWADTQTWITAHPPAGTACANLGTSGQWATVTSRFELCDTTCPPEVLYSCDVLVTTAAGSAGAGTAIRVDAQVVWLPSKPIDERVPSDDRVVTVSAYLAGRRSSPLSSRTLTDTPSVSDLARLVDDLAAAVPGARSCPALAGPDFEADFSGPVPAHEFTVVAGGCGGFVPVTLGGRPLVTLADTGLSDSVASLLGSSVEALDRLASAPAG